LDISRVLTVKGRSHGPGPWARFPSPTSQGKRPTSATSRIVDYLVSAAQYRFSRSADADELNSCFFSKPRLPRSAISSFAPRRRANLSPDRRACSVSTAPSKRFTTLSEVASAVEEELVVILGDVIGEQAIICHYLVTQACRCRVILDLEFQHRPKCRHANHAAM
jgi:hypothetical protein